MLIAAATIKTYMDQGQGLPLDFEDKRPSARHRKVRLQIFGFE